MIQRLFMIFLLAITIQQPLVAQEEGDKDKDKDKPKEEKQDTSKFRKNLFFGGYLWASFGTFGSSVEVAPQVGYHITDRWDAGIGAKYMFFGNYTNTNLPIIDTNTNKLRRTNYHIYGGNVFTSYVAIKDMNKILPFDFNGQLTVHLEYEGLNAPGIFGEESSGSRTWLHNYFVGGGLRQMLGERAFVSILLLYNLNEQGNIIYNNNPLLRIRFGF